MILARATMTKELGADDAASDSCKTFHSVYKEFSLYS